jgi:cytochrome c-type biogenesis protein CcmH/NrfG
MRRVTTSLFLIVAAAASTAAAGTTSSVAGASSAAAKPAGRASSTTAPAPAPREDRTPHVPNNGEASRRALDPTQVAPRVARLDSAEMYYAWNNYASVVRLLSKPKAERPREQLLLGWSYYRLGRMTESVRAFAAGLQLAPENLDLINGHAFALYRTGDPLAAEAEFKRILATNPEREESIRGLAAVLFTSQRFEEGLPIHDRLLREHPGDEEAEHHLVKSVDGMMTQWRDAGRTPADMVERAWKFAEAGDRRTAVEIFAWVLLEDPFHPGARLGMGTLGPAYGREPEARRCLEELLRENPNDLRARTALAQLHLDAGRTQEANEQVRVLLKARPGDPVGLELQRQIDGASRKKAP